jgi:cobalt-zinc-cadmium efflux system outer membrane protein
MFAYLPHLAYLPRLAYLLHPVCIFTACALALPIAASQPQFQQQLQQQLQLQLKLQPQLQSSSPTSLKVAVDAAWQRSPLARTLEARGAETLAGRDAAQTWIAGSPVIGLAQRSDRWTHQSDMRENEISLSAPFFLPGQKSARQTLAQSTVDAQSAQVANARLSIAGEVRERLWAVAAAREVLVEANDHEHHLQAIADEVMLRVQTGDLARTDGMLAQQEVLAAKGAIAIARRNAVDAWSRYQLLTGQSEMADLVFEAPSESAALRALQEQHPRMLAAQATLERERMALKLVGVTRSEPPVIGISMRRERDGAMAQSRNSIGIALQIPIGTSARNRPLETAALTNIATAMAQQAQTAAAISADIALAREQLDVSQQALEAAEARTALTREHTQLIERAFRLGERGLADLLRSRILAHDAESAQRQERVAVGLAHARINQASGVMP